MKKRPAFRSAFADLDHLRPASDAVLERDLAEIERLSRLCRECPSPEASATLARAVQLSIRDHGGRFNARTGHWRSP